jgi:hypothetical protein
MKKVWSGLAVLILMIIASIVVFKNQGKSTIKGELTNFAVEDTAAIDRIILKNQSGEMADLAREENRWLLNGKYKARPDGINNLLNTMKKVTVKSPVSQQAMNSTLKNIISNHVLVEAYDGSTLVKSYYVGGPNQTHTGTNMLMKGSERPFAMHIEGFHGFLTPRYFTSEKEWRNRAIFEYKREKIASLSIKYTEKPIANFSINIEPMVTGYVIKYGPDLSKVSTAMDTLSVSGYLKNYEKVHYESFEETKDQNLIDSVIASEPMLVMELTTTDGEIKNVKAFAKPLPGGIDPEGNPTDVDIDRLYLLINDDEFVIGQYAIFDPLTKGINFFKRG